MVALNRTELLEDFCYGHLSEHTVKEGEKAGSYGGKRRPSLGLQRTGAAIGSDGVSQLSRDDLGLRELGLAPVLSCTLSHQQSELYRGGGRPLGHRGMDSGPKQCVAPVFKDCGWYVKKACGDVGHSTRSQCSQWSGSGPGGNKVCAQIST